MLGKSWTDFRGIVRSTLGHSSGRNYDVVKMTEMDGSHLPPAKISVFRKRPLKLKYDHNHYNRFLLPSERTFIYGWYDTEDLLGKRRNTSHSPHIRTQMDLDSNILWVWMLASIALLYLEFGYRDKFFTLRANFLLSEKGWIKEEDLK